MNDIGNRLADLRRRIDVSSLRARRPASAVALIAVSKTFGADVLQAAWNAGQRCFGESYLQEALPKIAALAELGLDPEWHFIGPLQANKTRQVAEHFSWAHTVDRIRVAERLSAQRPQMLPPLNICVQVNISAEPSKSGCEPQAAAALCAAVSELPRLRLRGLMTIPQAQDDPEQSRPNFRALRDLQVQIRADEAVDSTQFDTLSMGMSDDFEVAIEEGATIVRIGNALFGQRPQ